MALAKISVAELREFRDRITQQSKGRHSILATVYHVLSSRPLTDSGMLYGVQLRLSILACSELIQKHSHFSLSDVLDFSKASEAGLKAMKYNRAADSITSFTVCNRFHSTN